MAVTINASTTAGLVQTADTSGVLALQTAGTTAVTVDASQNVGIGTASPAYPLTLGNNKRIGALNTAGAGVNFAILDGSNNVYLGDYSTNSSSTYLSGASNVIFGTGNSNTERMRIDSSGNVGIGTTTPTSGYKLNVGSTSSVLSLQGAAITLFTSGSLTSNIGGVLNFRPQLGTTVNDIFNLSICAYDHSGDSNADGLSINGADGVSFSTGGNSRNERMRIDSSGIVQIGGTTARTTQAKLELTSATNTALSFYMYKTSQCEMAMGFKSSTDTNFYIGTGSTSVGVNGVYLANTGTSWISNSDERLKENLVPITDAISKVSTLRSVIGNFIADESKTPRPFLIAQDVQQVLPEAIGKSEIDGVEYLGVSYTDTIPLLVAAIKEQQALITQLQADVAALKGATP